MDTSTQTQIFPYTANAQLTGKKWLAKIGERSEQKANCFLSLLNFLLCFTLMNSISFGLNVKVPYQNYRNH